MPENKRKKMHMPVPDPAFKHFEKMIGKWELKGRTLNSKQDNITGWSTFEWILDGFFIKILSEIHFNGMVLQSMEIINYDPDKKKFPAYAYSSMSSNVLPYEYDIQGNLLIHSGLGATYRGTICEDGNTIKGGWRPDEGTPSTDGNTNDVDMIRVEI